MRFVDPATRPQLGVPDDPTADAALDAVTYTVMAERDPEDAWPIARAVLRDESIPEHERYRLMFTVLDAFGFGVTD